MYVFFLIAESTAGSDSDVVWAATLTADKIAVKQGRTSAKPPDNKSTAHNSISPNSKGTHMAGTFVQFF